MCTSIASRAFDSDLAASRILHQKKINPEIALDFLYDHTLLAEPTGTCIFLPVSMNKYTLKNRVHHVFDFILVFL